MKTVRLTLPSLAACAAILTPILNAQVPVDRDGDGHSDLWQSLHGIPSANGSDDSDGDGVSDSDEERAGTNPFSGGSTFDIGGMELLHDARGERARFAWDALAGKRYQFSSSAGFTAGQWLDLGSPVAPSASGPASAEFPLPAGHTRRFFRASVSDVDNDRDGLTAFEESLIGTSDATPHSGGTGSPPDTDVAAAWAESHDPGKYAGAPQATLREVDVAWIREAPGAAGNGANLVTAAGSGAWHQLTSWRAGVDPNPSHLFTTPPIEGHHPQVHLLAPAVSASAPKFVTACIRGGNLWLSVRSLTANGSFVHFKTAGYGSNAGVEVIDYDLAHRTFSTRDDGVTHYHIVTPVVTPNTNGTGKSLRIVTWRVNALTGALGGLHDSGPIVAQVMAAATRMRIAHIAANQFELIYSSVSQFEVHHPVWTNDAGVPDSATGHVTLNNSLGNDTLSISRADSAVSGLSSSGYITALHDADDAFKLAVWDRRPHRKLAGVYNPHLLTDHTADFTPNNPGVAVPQPQLADSFDNDTQAFEEVGKAVATGDFNGDGVDDVAIGAPGRSNPGTSYSGGVFIKHGGFSGIPNEDHDQLWTQDSAGIGDQAETSDHFGSALASGDFNGDGNDDLAIGVLDENIGATSDAGAVHIVYGTAFGLNAAGSQFITHATVGGVVAANEGFGQVLAAGDFNGDGRDDLAIAIPYMNVNAATNAGAVRVLWGAAAGLSTAGTTLIHQDSGGVQDQAEDNDMLGRALGVADFNGDGKDDLAMGAPFEDIGNVVNAGAVHIRYGTAAGFGASSFVSRNGFDGGQDIQSIPDASDNFGFSLAGGDFNDDGADDLAIGVPGDSVLVNNGGAIHVLNGTFLGLTWINERMFRQAEASIGDLTLPGITADGEATGRALAAGDCNGDGFMDLVISSPGENVIGLNNAGAIFVVPGTEDGLIPGDGKFVPEDLGNLPGVAETNDEFAYALACGDFNADGESDIVAGIPYQDEGDNLSCGAVEIIPGFDDNLITSAGSIEWFVRERHMVRGILTDFSRENAYGIGAGKMFVHNENLDPVHMASSTKTMTLLLAVEAIEDGKASLNDMVPVSQLAGTTGGSKLDSLDLAGNSITDNNGAVIPFIQPGDTMPLRFLLAGMMGESCNRCSVAIGEHIAKKVTGDARDFILMMNARAAQLGMSDSVFGHPAGGWITQIQDTATLQREGVKHPLFVQFSSFERYGDDPGEVLCGTDVLGNPKCNGPHNQFTSMGTYPGRYTWKGGNGGLWWSNNEADGVPAKPPGAWCSTSRVTTARRMDRTLIACLQQTGSGDDDSQDLVEYGYRKIFTPDKRGSREFPEAGGLIGPGGPIRVRNFAIAAWEDRGVTAVIDDNEELRLNVWSFNFVTQQITPAGSAAKSYPLVGGAASAPSALVGLAEVPSQSAIADYFTANLIGDRLELKIWRVGEEP